MTAGAAIPRAWLLRVATTVIDPYYSTRYRIRVWGRLPARRGPTLLIQNHQHDLDNVGSVTKLVNRTWGPPVYSLGSRRMFEPGFMAMRLPWLSGVLRDFNAATLFGALGIMPIENEPRRRPLGALAWRIMLRHGDRPLGMVFEESAFANTAESMVPISRLSHPAHRALRDRYVSLAALRGPYRSEIVEETRTLVGEDLERAEKLLRAGRTLYLTPEGRYSKDGRLSRFRTALDRLAPLARVYVLPTSYDPFAAMRLPMLLRILPAPRHDDLASSLAGTRPIVLSQLLGAWLFDRTGSFLASDAAAAVEQRLRSLPKNGFIDPELCANAGARTGKALSTLVRLGIVVRTGNRFSVAATRRDPRFPHVDDVLAFQKNFLDETLTALDILGSTA